MDRGAEEANKDVEDDGDDYYEDEDGSGDEADEFDDDVLDEDSQTPGLVPEPTPANVLAGRIEMLDALGEGATGQVWRGYHLKLEREVAVKVLDDGLHLRVDGRERFLREARALGRLKHPGIVGVYDCDEVDGRLFLCMELLDGETLRSLRERGERLDPERAIDIGIQVCDAVQSAHDKGILHRDLSASNIMLLREPAGRVKVIDWGLCKYLDQFWTRGEHRYGAPPGTRLATPLGARFGTPEYMAPELLRGEDPSTPTTATDVYALGVVLYELLTAAPPFRPGDRKQSRAIAEFVPGFDHVELEAAIRRAIAYDPRARTQTMAALREELERASCALTDGRHALSTAAVVAPSASLPVPTGPSPTTSTSTAETSAIMTDPSPAPAVQVAAGTISGPSQPIGWLAAHKTGLSLALGVVLGSTGTLAAQRASIWYEDQITAPLKDALTEEKSQTEAAELRAESCEATLDEVEAELSATRAVTPSSPSSAESTPAPEPPPELEVAPVPSPAVRPERTPAPLALRRRTSARTLDTAGPQVRACYDRYGGSKIAALAVRVTIDPGGRARDVRLLGDAISSALLRCVTTAVQEHRYPIGDGTITVSHTFALRMP